MYLTINNKIIDSLVKGSRSITYYDKLNKIYRKMNTICYLPVVKLSDLFDSVTNT